MGGRVFNIVVMIVVVLFFHITVTDAVTHTVGGPLNWQTPPNTAAYSTWAAANTFLVGDTLVFNFATGSHDVAVVRSRAAFDACDSSNPITLLTTGPANYDLNSTGDHYFFCAVDGHCNQGQKFSISVSASSNESPASPPPPSTGTATPSPPPPPSGETTPSPPPPPSSASSLAAFSTFFSVIFMSIATGVLW